MKLLNKYTLISILALTFIIAYNVSAKTALTPLHLYKWAQEHNVSRLHQFHKYINLKNHEGSTALCIAQKYKDKQAYDLLLRFGASTNVACHNPNDDVCTIKTTTKLEKTNYTTPALLIGASTGIAALALGGGGSKAQPPTSCPLGYSTQYQSPVDCSSTGNDQGWVLVTHETIRIDGLPCNKCEKKSCPVGDTSYISSSNCPFIDGGLRASSQEGQYYSGDDNCYTCSYQCDNETRFDYLFCLSKFSDCSSEYSFSYENTSLKCYTPDPCEETFDTEETIGCPTGLKPVSRCTEGVGDSYDQQTLLYCVCNGSTHFNTKETCEEKNLGYECRQKEGETCYTVSAPLECANGYATFVNSCGRIGGYTLDTTNTKGYSSGLNCYKCQENLCNVGFTSGSNIKDCDISNGYTYTQDTVSNGERTCGKCEATPCPLGSKIYPSAASCPSVDYDGQGWKLVKTGVSGGMDCSICEKINCSEGLTSCPTYPNLTVTRKENTYYSGNNACYTCSYECKQPLLYKENQASECKLANAGSDCLEINENNITCYDAKTQCDYDIYNTHGNYCPTGSKEVGRCVDSNEGTKYTHLKCECDTANGYYLSQALCLNENPGYECDGLEPASNCITKGTIKQCPEYTAPQDELSCDTHEYLNLLPITATTSYNGEKRCYECNYSPIHSTSNSCESANQAKACSPENITIKGKTYTAYYVSGCNLDKGYYENEQGCPDGYECSELNGCLYKSSQTPCETPTSALYIDATKCPLYDTTTRETTVTPTGFKSGENDCYSCSYTCIYTGKDDCEEDNNGMICDIFDGCYAPTECNPSKGYYAGTEDCLKANPGYQCNQQENKCILKGDEKTQCNNTNASPAYISNANCPTHDAVKKEASTQIANDYIGTSNCYTCNYSCTYSSDKECYEAPSALGRICEPTDISLLGNTYTCYEIKGCNETTHFTEQKACEEHENNKRYQCTKENGCYTKSNTPLACVTGTTEAPINHPSLSYVSREETGFSGEKSCYIYTYKCNNENSNHYYETCPTDYTSCSDITINVSHASQESYTCYTPNQCDTTIYNNLEQCANVGQIPEEGKVCKDLNGNHLKCKCDQENGYYTTKEDCLAVHQNKYKCDGLNESGTCITKGSPETCPLGFSTQYQSIEDCGTSDIGPKDKSQGWIYSSDETIFAGEEKCGKCEAIACDTKNGYTSGLNASQCDTENGYNYFSKGYNGDNICGKCEKRTCSEGFSTQYQSIEDCGKYNDGKIGWVFESDGKSEGLVCGKCNKKTCLNTNFINIQTQQTQVGNCKNYAVNQGITFLEEDSFTIDDQHKDGDYDCVHCTYKCGPDTPYTSETECIQSQGDNTVTCTKHTISNFFTRYYECYSVNGCDENIYPFETCPTGLISSSECSITGDTRHACICDKTQGYYIPSEETACQDGTKYTCNEETIDGVNCLKRTCNVEIYPFVGSCPAGTKVKSSCSIDGEETRYSCECDSTKDYYAITDATTCTNAGGDTTYTCTEETITQNTSSITCLKRTCNEKTYPFDACPTGTAITSTCQTKNNDIRHTCACDETQGNYSVDNNQQNSDNYRKCITNNNGLEGYTCEEKDLSSIKCYTRTERTCANGATASYQTDYIACRKILNNEAVNTQGWDVIVDDTYAAGEQYCIQCPTKTCPNGGKAIETTDIGKNLATLSGKYCAKKSTNTTGWKLTISDKDFSGDKKCGFCEINQCETGKKADDLKCEEKDGDGFMFFSDGTYYSGDEACGKCTAVPCEKHDECYGGKCSKQEDISTCPIVEDGKEGGWTIKATNKKSGNDTCYACSPKACEVGTATDFENCPIPDEYLKTQETKQAALGMFAGNEQCYTCSYECSYSDCTKVPLNEGETCSNQNITVTITGKDPITYTCPKKDIAPTPASANQTFIGKTGSAGETIVNPTNETISMQTFGDNTFVGMYTQTGGTAINEGKIEITGDTGTAIGILGDGQNTIENKGTINVSGEHAYGIKVIDGTDTSITNSGEINVSATSDAYGIYIEENGNLATVTNTGTISINGNLNDKNNAIVLNGAELRNQNQFNVEGDLDIKSLQARAFVVERGSQITAQSVEGELTAGISTVQSDENKDQYVEENSVVANDTSNLEVKSESALFKASTQQNAQGNTNIVLDRKDFKEFTPNSSMGEYLNKNYQDGNFVDTFNSMKEATSAFDIASKSVKFMGADNMLNFVDENIQVLRGLNRNIAETILTPDDDKPYRVLSGAHNYSLETDDKGLLSGYDINSNSVYMFGDKRLNNWSRLGLGLSFTDINSSYEHGGSRDLSYVNIFVPYLYKFNPNLNLASILSFGYGYGDFERDSIHTSELSQFTYGLTNELRYTMDLNGFAELEPALMLNVLGYHENGLSEGKDDTAIITKNNHALSVEAGLGLFVKKQVKTSENSKLGFKVGGIYYHEFASPYRDITARHRASNHWYKINDYANLYKHDRAVLEAVVDYMYKDISVYLKYNKLIQNNNPEVLDLGIKYNF